MPTSIPSPARIRALAREIAERFRPERIILFGSHACGRPTSHSDVDLLVVMKTKERAIVKAAEISASVRHDVPIDIVVVTPQSLKRRLHHNDFFLMDAVGKGRVLYERTNGTLA